MNERELSLIKVLGEEFGQVLAEMRDSFSKNLQAQREEYEEKLLRLAKQVEEISNAPDPDIESMVKAAIAHLPAPTAPGLPDIATMVSDAVAAIPAPRDGKSVTPEDVQPMIQELVRNAVAEIPTPKDGKDFDPSMLKQLVEQAVSDAVSTMPAAEPGKDGADGRDALALEILPLLMKRKAIRVAAMQRITAACGALTRKPMACEAGSVLLMAWRVLIFSNQSSVASP